MTRKQARDYLGWFIWEKGFKGDPVLKWFD